MKPEIADSQTTRPTLYRELLWRWLIAILGGGLVTYGLVHPDGAALLSGTIAICTNTALFTWERIANGR